MSGKKRKSIKIDMDQWERAKKLKKNKGKEFKQIFEKGLIFFENDQEFEYNILLNDEEKLKSKLISQKAKIEHKRRELRIVADNFHDALNDVLNIWKDSEKELDVFCQDNLQYLAKIMGEYNEILNLEDFKKLLKEKKNF